MLTLPFTYEDFDGNSVTETFYFNLSKTELLNLEHSVDGGLSQMYQNIVASQDAGSLIKEFQKLILASYGTKSEDGKRFIKTEQQTKEFEQTAAYDALFIRLAQDDAFAADFFIGVMPKDFRGFVEEARATVELPPPPVS